MGIGRHDLANCTAQPPHDTTKTPPTQSVRQAQPAASRQPRHAPTPAAQAPRRARGAPRVVHGGAGSISCLRSHLAQRPAILFARRQPDALPQCATAAIAPRARGAVRERERGRGGWAAAHHLRREADVAQRTEGAEHAQHVRDRDHREVLVRDALRRLRALQRAIGRRNGAEPLAQRAWARLGARWRSRGQRRALRNITRRETDVKKMPLINIVPAGRQLRVGHAQRARAAALTTAHSGPRRAPLRRAVLRRS